MSSEFGVKKLKLIFEHSILSFLIRIPDSAFRNRR